MRITLCSPPTTHDNEVERMITWFNGLKHSHNTNNGIEALDREGVAYSIYPDERATPTFIRRLETGRMERYGSTYNYTLELNRVADVYVMKFEFALVLRGKSEE